MQWHPHADYGVGPLVWSIAVAAASLLGIGATTAAQPAAAISSLSIKPMHPGDCVVAIDLINPRPGDDIGVIVELTEYQEQTVTAGVSTLSFPGGSPLRVGFRVRACLNGAVVATQTVPDAAAGSQPTGRCATPAPSTEDSPFDASAYFGQVVDTFAPDSVGGYRNPEAGTQQKLRTTFGVDFDYRAGGKADSRVQFWINGETLHGVRTADINCKPPDPKDAPPMCSKTSTYADRARYILEHATSLEAFVSPRLEFATFQGATLSPARLYVTTQ